MKLTFTYGHGVPDKSFSLFKFSVFKTPRESQSKGSPVEMNKMRYLVSWVQISLEEAGSLTYSMPLTPATDLPESSPRPLCRMQRVSPEVGGVLNTQEQISSRPVKLCLQPQQLDELSRNETFLVQRPKKKTDIQVFFNTHFIYLLVQKSHFLVHPLDCWLCLQKKMALMG